MIPHVLLVQLSSGATAGIYFMSLNDARQWEDEHPEVETIGCVPLVSRAAVVEGER